MAARTIAESDIALILELLEALPEHDVADRIRRAIADGRRVADSRGAPGRSIALEAADATLFRDHVRTMRNRYSAGFQLSLDRIVSGLDSQ
ncbi:MAG TPA: hypothetical protein VHT71_06385 [Methylomirabilota bacterium]|jgi:hypothetical protein|nr:hypothetical protein [Methylomirabilota bacterium]